MYASEGYGVLRAAVTKTLRIERSCIGRRRFQSAEPCWGGAGFLTDEIGAMADSRSSRGVAWGSALGRGPRLSAAGWAGRWNRRRGSSLLLGRAGRGSWLCWPIESTNHDARSMLYLSPTQDILSWPMEESTSYHKPWLCWPLHRARTPGRCSGAASSQGARLAMRGEQWRCSPRIGAVRPRRPLAAVLLAGREPPRLGPTRRRAAGTSNDTELEKLKKRMQLYNACLCERCCEQAGGLARPNVAEASSLLEGKQSGWLAGGFDGTVAVWPLRDPRFRP
jgi:hypothetical protein